jgi:hypothetical protein
MSIGKHWLCGLFAVLFTLLIARTVSDGTNTIGYSGGPKNDTLGPGTYDITGYGAAGGYSTFNSHSGGIGAEMEAQFNFTSPTAPTLMVGGSGAAGPVSPRGPGGGGTFVVNGDLNQFESPDARLMFCVLLPVIAS